MIKNVAQAYERHDEIIQCFDQIVKKYRNTCPEAFSCSLLEREKVHILAHLPAKDNYLTIYTPEGSDLNPLICSAGKVLLSRFDDSSVENLYDLQYDPKLAKELPQRRTLSNLSVLSGVLAIVLTSRNWEKIFTVYPVP